MRHEEFHKPTEPWIVRFVRFIRLLWACIWNPPLRLDDGTTEPAGRSLYWTFAKQTDLFWRTKFFWYDGGVEEMFKDLDSTKDHP